MSKLQTLAEDWGFDDEMAMLESATFDSVCPGICRNKDCNYSTEVEPDQRHGWCEECEAGTVQSALVIKGII